MDVVFAATTAVVAHAGLRVRVNAGEVWAADDPVVEQYSDMFSDTPKAVRVSTNQNGWAPVETTRGAPGEKSSAMSPERAQLLQECAERGIRVRANASLDSIRAKLAEAQAEADADDKSGDG